MKLWVGVTDKDWFAFLSGLQPPPAELNFWQPGGQTRWHAIEPGAPFLFKLHSPHNYIVGGGSFVQQYRVPVK